MGSEKRIDHQKLKNVKFKRDLEFQKKFEMLTSMLDFD
jgi:hypothetical protein